MATPYLTPAAIRLASPLLADDSKYPDATLATLVAEFEWIAEDYRGVAFTPRTTTETQTVRPGAGLIILNWPRVRSVTSVVVDGTTVDGTSYRASEGGSIETYAGFVAGAGYGTAAAVITYDHGLDVPTATSMPGAALLRACRLYVQSCAVADRSTVPRDIIATSADGMTNRYSTPDKRAGRPTGYLDIDRLLNALPDYRIPTIA